MLRNRKIAIETEKHCIAVISILCSNECSTISLQMKTDTENTMDRIHEKFLKKMGTRFWDVRERIPWKI